MHGFQKKGTLKTLYQWLVERFNGTLKEVLKRFCTFKALSIGLQLLGNTNLIHFLKLGYF